MANSDWLTDKLLESIKRRGNVSTSDDGWSDSDLLAIATDEMRESIVPMLRRLNEEFLVNDYDQNIVSGTSDYSLPSWALAEGLRDVQVSDGSGGYVSLRRKEPYDASGRATQVQADCYFLRDDRVVLVPEPSSNVTSGLRMRCLRRPSKLVDKSRGFTVAAVAATYLQTTPIDSSVAVDALTFFGSSGTVDVGMASPGFRVLGAEVAVAINGSPFENRILCTPPDDSAEGDYVTLPGESVVPQIPADLHPLLAQATLCAFLRASGQPGLEAAEMKRAAMEAEAISAFSPRTQNQPRYIHNKYGARTGYRRT